MQNPFSTHFVEIHEMGLVLVWVHSFIEPADVLKTKVPFDNTAQIYLINLQWKLGLGFQLRLRVALF